SPVRLPLRPVFLGAPVKAMSTDEVKTMAVRFGEVAAWAREAGYDGIQLASGNAKLLHQFLSPFYNRRTDEFGGSVEKRASLLRGVRTPFRPVWNRRIFAEAERRLSIPVFAVGGIRTAEEVNGVLEAGEADMVGIGRPFYAEPDLAARVLAGSEEPRRCRNSN